MTKQDMVDQINFCINKIEDLHTLRLLLLTAKTALIDEMQEPRQTTTQKQPATPQ